MDASVFNIRMNRRGLLAITCALLLSSTLPGATLAQEQSDPNKVADTFLKSLSDGDLNDAYQNFTTPSFKELVTEAGFSESVGIFRIQSGGVAKEFQLVGSQRYSQGQDGRKGDFYYTRYKAEYSNAPLFWDVWLEKIGDKWLVGYFSYAQPPASASN